MNGSKNQPMGPGASFCGGMYASDRGRLEGLASASPAGRSGSSRIRLVPETGGDSWLGSEAMSVPSVEADEGGGRSVLEEPDFESGEAPDVFVMGGMLHKEKSD